MKQDARKNLASAQETEEAPCNEEIHGGEEIKGVGSVKIEDQGRHICGLYLSSHPHPGLKSSPAGYYAFTFLYQRTWCCLEIGLNDATN
jgi:hypothetical protein